MKANHGFSLALSLGRGLCALALALVQVGALAAKLPAWGSVPYGQSGKTTSFGLGNQSGSITPPPGWQAAGNYGIPKAPVQGMSFGLGADGKVFIPNKAGYYDGVMYPYRVGGDLKLGDLAAAAAGFLGGPLGLACMLACPLAIDWLGKSGGRINPQSGALERAAPGQCVGSSSCNFYTPLNYGKGEWATVEEVCAAVLQGLKLAFPTNQYILTGAGSLDGTGGGGTCPYQETNRFGGVGTGSAGFKRVVKPPTSCEAPIGCIRCSSGLGLRDWKSPNTRSTQEAQPDEHP